MSRRKLSADRAALNMLLRYNAVNEVPGSKQNQHWNGLAEEFSGSDYFEDVTDETLTAALEACEKPPSRRPSGERRSLNPLIQHLTDEECYACLNDPNGLCVEGYRLASRIKLRKRAPQPSVLRLIGALQEEE